MKRDREQTSSSADNNNGSDKDAETVSKAKPTKAVELNASNVKKTRVIVEENKDERVAERALEVSEKDIEDKTPAKVTVRIVCV